MLDAKQIKEIQKTEAQNGSSLPNAFAALGDKNRFRIIKLLIEHGQICVSDLAAILSVSVSAVSQHLKILEVSGLVECERMGQMMCYKPKSDNPKINKIINLI